jgi:L-ascorbate metabolism protein UlaG (beta-lactamase superfamily)
LFFVGTATTVLRLALHGAHRSELPAPGQWSYFGQGLVSRRRTDPAIEIAELPKLDAVLLSHLHGDHFDRVASRELDRDLPIVTTRTLYGGWGDAGSGSRWRCGLDRTSR